jgi:hypothetical protein
LPTPIAPMPWRVSVNTASFSPPVCAMLALEMTSIM